MIKPVRSHRQRLSEGIAFAYASHVLTLASGLIVTRVIIHNVDVSGYGVWLTALQFANYANLLDFGVLAVLPRDVATLNETPDPLQRGVAVSQILAQSTRTVLLQTVFLFGAGAAAVIGLPFFVQKPPLELAAFALIVIAFRPARLLYAALDGLREFALLGRIALATPIVTAVGTIALIHFHLGLLGVIGGWLLGQLFSAGALYVGLKKTEPSLLAAILAAPFDGAWTMPWSTGWILSLQQIAQLLINGSDVLLVSWILGPAAVPAYVCTTKAGYLLATLPQMIMNLFVPTLASLRASRSDIELTRIIQALAFAMLTVAGVVALGTVGLNEMFVGLWVGPSFYLGHWLTILVAAAVFLRQGALVIVTAAFAWGEEIALSKAALAEAILFTIAAIVGLKTWGVAGIPSAAILAMLTVSIPLNGLAINRRVNAAFPLILGTLYRRSLSLLVSAAILMLGSWLVTGYAPGWMVLVTGASIGFYTAVETWRLYKEQLSHHLPQPLQRLLALVFFEAAQSK